MWINKITCVSVSNPPSVPYRVTASDSDAYSCCFNYTCFIHSIDPRSAGTIEALLNCFLSGLRQDIQQELSILHPHTITHAISLAKLIEDKSNAQVTTPTCSTLLEAPSRSSEALPIKRISSTDMQKRRAEGLSYN